MPRKRNQDLTFAPFSEVMQLALSAEMIDDVKTWIANKAEVDQAFEDLCDQFHATSLKPTTEGGYRAGVQVLDPYSANAGRMLFGTGPTKTEAKAVLLVKLSFLGLATDWSTKTSSGSQGGYR